MVYTASITASKQGEDGDVRDVVLSVAKGLIYRIEVDFPLGCSGLVHVQIFDGGYQLYPASPGEAFQGEGVIVGFDDLYMKQVAPFEFRILVRNKDECWPHTIQVRIGMASSEAFMARYMPGLTWKKIQETMAMAAAEQEERRRIEIELAAKELGEL